jgi:hypothetical protein
MIHEYFDAWLIYGDRETAPASLVEKHIAIDKSLPSKVRNRGCSELNLAQPACRLISEAA